MVVYTEFSDNLIYKLDSGTFLIVRGTRFDSIQANITSNPYFVSRPVGVHFLVNKYAMKVLNEPVKYTHLTRHAP